MTDVMNQSKTIVAALTGASGAIYGIRLVKALLDAGVHTQLILSDAAKMVLSHEMDMDGKNLSRQIMERYSMAPETIQNMEVFSADQIGAPPASGSFVHQGMVVAPCSMKTLAAVASGFADNLITRSCDVCLKEKRPLILLPRETPFHAIHLENMARVERAGGTIFPPNPSFYSRPATIEELVDTVIARVLDHLGVAHALSKRWPACP